MQRIILQRGNDQVVTLPRLRTNEESPTFQNTATVVGRLIDPKGNDVPGYSSIPMSYVAASQGTYTWTIDGISFMMPSSTLYLLEITAAQGASDFREVVEVTIQD